MKTKMVIFDIDGTLSDTQHRQHFLEQGDKKDWESFFAAQSEDPIRQEVADVLDMYVESNIGPLHVALLTGRGEEYRQTTIQWLNKHHIYFNSLTMRPKGDRTDDTILKMEEINRWEQEGYQIIGFFDDRKRICDAARNHGLTVFQMAEGDF